jgi:hypothetical protein
VILNRRTDIARNEQEIGHEHAGGIVQTDRVKQRGSEGVELETGLCIEKEERVSGLCIARVERVSELCIAKVERVSGLCIGNVVPETQLGTVKEEQARAHGNGCIAQVVLETQRESVYIDGSLVQEALVQRLAVTSELGTMFVNLETAFSWTKRAFSCWLHLESTALSLFCSLG